MIHIDSFFVSDCNKITDTGIGHLVHEGITYLDISHCSRLTSLSMKYIANKCKKLVHLDISYCNFQSDFIAFFSNLCCQQLKYLNISDLRFHYETFCRAFASQNLLALHTFIAKNCSDLNDSCLILIAKTARHLRHLCLSGCVELSDDSLGVVAQNCNAITHLDISFCDKITSKTAKHLGSYLNSIQEIIMDGCSFIYHEQKENFHSFIQHNSELKKISLKHIPIDNEAIDYICKYCCDSLQEIELESTSVSSVGKE
jgi:F-box/leucine-rich repeat protein 2/20